MVQNSIKEQPQWRMKRSVCGGAVLVVRTPFRISYVLLILYSLLGLMPPQMVMVLFTY